MQAFQTRHPYFVSHSEKGVVSVKSKQEKFPKGTVVLATVSGQQYILTEVSGKVCFQEIIINIGELSPLPMNNGEPLQDLDFSYEQGKRIYEAGQDCSVVLTENEVVLIISEDDLFVRKMPKVNESIFYEIKNEEEQEEMTDIVSLLTDSEKKALTRLFDAASESCHSLFQFLEELESDVLDRNGARFENTVTFLNYDHATINMKILNAFAELKFPKMINRRS